MQCRSYPKCEKQAALVRRAEARPTPAKRDKCRVRQAASVLGSSSGNFSLPPFTGEGARRAEGWMKLPSDVNAGFAKQCRCWVLPLPLLLLRRCRQRLYILLSAIALPCYFKSCQAAYMLDSPSGVVTGFRRDVACNVSETKNRIAPRNVFLAQCKKAGCACSGAEARPTPAKRCRY